MNVRRRVAEDASAAAFGGAAEDAGNALLLAVGVTAVALGLGLTAASTAVTASDTSGRDRQRASLGAAAESGIDYVHAQLAAATTSWPCATQQTLAVGSGSDPSTVTMTLQYLADDGSTTTCSGSPTALLVRSQAVADRAIAGSGQARRTMVARFALSSSVAGKTTKQAVFGQAGVEAYNTFDVAESTAGANDAEVYTNTGSYHCWSQGTVAGPITSQQDVALRNSCSVLGTVWTAGRFTADPTATIAGDVYAAATFGTGIAIDNGTRIAGNAYTNGDVTLGNASVGGSVLSTHGSVSFGNGGHVDGSVYAGRGLTYTTGSGGWVGRDVVAQAGSIAAYGLDPWSIGGNASASPSGCVTNTVTAGGTVSPARTPLCWPSLFALNQTVPFPTTPNNPSGVSAPALPATVAAPPYRPFPTLYGRTLPGTVTDALASWRAAGWDVHVFSGNGFDGQACTDAAAYLKTVRDGGVNHAAWVAKPLAIVIRGCAKPFYWDQNNGDLLSGGTFWLFNDLAVISDQGVANANAMRFASDTTTARRLMWIVPTDSPDTLGAPYCMPWTAALTPNNVSTSAVSWFLFTPCAIQPQNMFGSSAEPVSGNLYGGTITVSNGWLKFAPMPVPGFDDGSESDGLSASLSYLREVEG